MATQIAHIIQGKNTPHYRPNKIDVNSDKCVIVNAKYVYLTGNKLENKIYRHHTGKINRILKLYLIKVIRVV